MRKIFVSVIAALALFGVSVPSAQAADITVQLDVTLFGTADVADCDLTVADGADGIALLDEAVDDDDCDVTSYQTSTHPMFGTGVDCINRICGVPSFCVAGECVDDGQPPLWGLVTFWGILEDGAPSGSGIEGLSLEDGDDIGLDYTNFLI